MNNWTLTLLLNWGGLALKKFMKKFYFNTLFNTVLLITSITAFTGDHGSIHPW
ncbi:conserved protein of unknown function [Paenibacillus alvei]|uniref:Uncharacterized protein n=1 Tax=Paenibacillus alvei TaxID=44250 RepID=A0A383RDI2_PAEAL|nr:conserved protein of unknown function [Paenibacillus alvei]